MAKERLEAKYGLAALLNPEWPGDFCARQFVGLPLQSVSKLGLPVHVNAVCDYCVKLDPDRICLTNLIGYNN